MEGAIKVLIGFVLLNICDGVQISPPGNIISSELTNFLKNNVNQSYVTSGYSIVEPLQMLLLAASGDTKMQLEKVLESSKDPAKLGLSSWSDVAGGANYSTATRIYLGKNYLINANYNKETNELFGTDVVNTDFSNKPEAAAEINNWVQKKTDNLIKDLVTPKEISPNIIALIVNTLLFEAEWKSAFKAKQTKEADFYQAENLSKKVTYMHQLQYYPYGILDELDTKVIQLDLKGDKSYLKVYLPNKIDGLPILLEKLHSTSSLKTKVKLSNEYLHLAMPKFEISTTVSLKKFLLSLGITDLFDQDKASLPYLTQTSQPAAISEFKQKAYIKIDETGVSAAVSNAVVQALGILHPPKPIEVKLDRPFYFEIVHSDATLFSGVYRG